MSVPYDQKERRHFSRILFDAGTVLITPYGRWNTHLVDLSLKGALIQAPEDWEGNVNDQVVLEIELTAQQKLIRMQATVIHRGGEGIMGLRCDYLDVDSVTHLKRLVQLNLGDEQLLNREMHALWNE